MASSIVGALRVILSADTADFKSGLGEASKLTGQFSGQMTGLTTTVSTFSRAFAGMFTVGAITAAASKVLDYASKVSDLAEKTGLTTDSIQEMGHAAKQSGASLEGFTNAAFKLGLNLAEGTNKVIGATERLGLAYDALVKMSPDDQFKAIAASLKQVEDVQERNRLGVILMGRGYAQVAGAINEGYADLAKNASVSSAAQIKALKEAGDEWDKFSGKVMNLGVIVGGSFAKSMSQLGTALRQDWEFIQAHTLDRVTQAIEDWKTIFGKMGPAPTAPGSPRRDLPAPIRALTMDAEELAKVEADLTKRGKESIETNKARIGSLKDLKREEEDRLDALKELGRLEARIVEENERFRAEAVAGIDAEKRAWRDYYTWLGERRMEDEDRTQSFREAIPTSMDLSKMFEPFKAAVTQSLPNISEWTKAWGGMKTGLSAVLSDIPQTLANAFTGGGDIMGAIKSIVSQLGSAVGAGIGFAVGGELGQKIGAAIGSMAGLLVEPFKKLFGIGMNDAIKKFNKEIEVSRQSLLKQFGSLERIDRLGKAIGVDLAGAWRHQGEAGLKAFKELAEEFEKRVGEMEDDLEGFKDELEGVIDEARDMGYIFDRAGNLVSVKFQKMQELAEEFGVDLAALGPSFQNAKIQDQAAKIVNAFELLSKGGTDAGTILFGLKDEISQIVQQSIAAGTTLPEQMRPWIAELIRAGLLLNANGDAITDIGQIQFGAAIETQFERISNKIVELLSKIDELINTLMRELTPALDDATRDRNIHIGFDVDPLPEFAGMSAPRFAGGTKGVLGSWFGNFGSGMAATLDNVEAVVTPQQAPAFALDVLSKLSSQGTQAAATAPQTQRPIIVELRNVIELNGHEMKRWNNRSFVESVENNEGGIRSLVRDALGVTT